MITRYVPMAPTLVSKPFHRDGWVYEEKKSAGATLRANHCENDDDVWRT